MTRFTPLSVPESDPRTCSAGTRVNALARVPFFAGLDHATLHRVDDRADMRGIEAGEAVHLAGRPAERLHVVATGAFKLTSTAADGNEVLLDVLGPGDFLGSVPELGRDTHAEDAWALTPGCLLSFSASAFGVLLDEHPSIGRAALGAVGRRWQQAQERLRRAATEDAPARIAGTLLVLAERLGADDGDRIVIDVPLSREDLAGLAGCASETVSRHLSRWRRDGLVDTGRRWVALRDPRGLATVAGTDTSLVAPGHRDGPA